MGARTTGEPGGPGRLGGHRVARAGFGTMQLERLLPDRPTAVALVRRALDLGVDHLDTAGFYGAGAVNEVLREALPRTDRPLVVTKVGAEADPGGPRPLRAAQKPDQLRAQVERDLRTLGVERLDVVNLRRLDTGPGLRAEGDQRVDLDDQLAVLTGLRDAGVVGDVGLSGVTLETFARARAAGVVCVQNGYSLLDREDDPVLEACRADGVAYVPFFPLGSAFEGWASVGDDPVVRATAARLGATPSQIGLAWLLHRAPNVLLIPGTASVAHLEENLAAGDLVLDAEAREALDARAVSPGP